MCNENTSCKAIMYGNGQCELLKRLTPMTNLDGLWNEKNMYQCEHTIPMQYPGITNKTLGQPLSCSEHTSQVFGALACDNQHCVPPYQSQQVLNKENCKTNWETLMRYNKDVMTNTQDKNIFLNNMCSHLT